MKRRFRNHISYANVVSVLVLVLALGGTAAAATTLLTTKNVQDGSLTGKDVQDGSLALTDLTRNAVASLTGSKGDSGVGGAHGAVGPQGPRGQQGDRGRDAVAIESWATYDAGAILDADTNGGHGNSGATDWDSSSYGGAGGVSNYNSGQAIVIPIQSGGATVLALSGMAATSPTWRTTGTLNTSYEGQVAATATLNFMHQKNGEDGFDSAGHLLHDRLRCQLNYGDGNVPVGAGSQPLGTFEIVSSAEEHELVTMTLTAAKKIGLGNYNIGANCIDMDGTNNAKWIFVGGSLSALGTQVKSGSGS